MSDSRSASPSIDMLTKVVTVISLAIGVFATWIALPADAEIKRLQAETQRLDLALKQADAELKSLEFNRRVTLELYQEVKKVIEKGSRDPREEDAVRVLVESLADDPFRWKLLRVMAVGAQSSAVKATAAKTSTFYEEEAQVQQRAAVPAARLADTKRLEAAGLRGFNLDIFFCEKRRATSEPLANAVRELDPKSEGTRWRVRALPESINQQPGYGINGNEIRFTAPQERPMADALAHALSVKGIDVRFRETTHPTPGYVSVFICQ